MIASPSELVTLAATKHPLFMKICMLIMYLIIVGFSFVAVAAKLSQFSFLATVDFLDWTGLFERLHSTL